MKDSYIRVRLSGELKKELEGKALEAGVSMSEYIRRLVGEKGDVITKGDIPEDVPTRDSKWGGKPIFKDEKLNKGFDGD